MHYLTPFALAMPWAITRDRAFSRVADTPLWVGFGHDSRLRRSWRTTQDTLLVEEASEIPSLVSTLKSVLPTAVALRLGRRYLLHVRGREVQAQRVDDRFVLVHYRLSPREITVRIGEADPPK